MIGAYLGRILLGRIMVEEEFGYVIAGLIPLRHSLKIWESGLGVNSQLIGLIPMEIMSQEIADGPIALFKEIIVGR